MASNASENSSANETDDQKRWYHLTWLDQCMNNHSNIRYLKLLKEIDPNIKSVTSEEECINYVRKQDDEKNISHIILIISGALSEKVIPKIQDYRCVLAIFIFCTNYDNYKHLKYRKLREICTQRNELIDSIEIFITKYNDITEFSLFPGQYCAYPVPVPSEDQSTVQYSIRNLQEDQASFLWFRQMHEFMITLENDDDQNAKEETISHCRKQYKEKSKMQSKIDEFSAQSLLDDKKKAISLYTENSFVHKCTNTVLRKENISQVYSNRYIIKLICQQLKELHKQFIDKYREEKQKPSLRLYRGQHLKSDQIKILTKNIKNLISLNGFVSTTRDKDIAINFIRNRWQDDAEPVLFKIDVDMTSEHSVAFADISKLSKFPEEKEVILSIGSVFRVKSVDLVDIDDQQKLTVIYLSLSQTNQLTVINYIEQTYANNVDSADRSVLFGKLLFDMGECEAAVKYFLDAFNRLSDDNYQLRAAYLNNIGVCYTEMGRKKVALEYHNAALEIYEQTNNKRGLSACQHNIASIYHAQGYHQEALSWALEAFQIRQESKIEKASTLNLLGCIHLASYDIEAAVINFEDALKLRLKYLGEINPYHPDIGVSYHNLGKAISRSPQYLEAPTNYSRAAEIYRHNYPPSHPLVKEITKCLERTQ